MILVLLNSAKLVPEIVDFVQFLYYYEYSVHSMLPKKCREKFRCKNLRKK